MENPKISYLVSSYRDSSWLNKHLADFDRQRDKNFEVIVVNETGVNDEFKLACDWASRRDNIHVIQVPNSGSYGPYWLEAWKIARGDFVVNSWW